ncbi:MAG: hypothetical protein NC301_03260 [Bacteroides sp.]|nr:hypothetical protein [Bacteroides sp.]MCM1379154.1 hypothetical protein [Bacteroides sp.]MCM1445197.1 hypothetical protein [Prevotella sp.]
MAGCTQVQRDNRQAGLYAEQLERGESVSAAEYGKMVAFYCEALDRTLDEIEPAAKAHVAALEAADSVRVVETAAALDRTAAEAHKKRENLIRLGSGLQRNFSLLPDSLQRRLTDHIMAVTLRYSNFH